MTDILRKKLEPLFELFIDKVISDIAARIEAAFDRAAPPTQVEKSSAPKPAKVVAKKAKRTKAKEPKAKVVKGEAKPANVEVEQTSSVSGAKPPGKRATMRCRKCGTLGFRSDGCGKTHNVDGQVAKPALTPKQAEILARIKGVNR